MIAALFRKLADLLRGDGNLVAEPPPWRPSGERPAVGGKPVVLVRSVDHTVPAQQLGEDLIGAGFDVVLDQPPHTRRSQPNQVLVLLTPGSLRRSSQFPDMLNALERMRSYRDQNPLVVVWCVRGPDRLAMAAPHRTGPGYDLKQTPLGWNASWLLVGSSWRRTLRATSGNADAATLMRDGALRELLRAPSHSRIAGQDTAQVLALFEQLDPRHLHTIAVETQRHGWHLDGVVAAVGLRCRAAADRIHGEA